MISIEETIKNIQNPILKRGEMTFLTKVHAATPSLTPSALNRATLLSAAFHGNIAAMPVEGSYAAVRLASAVLAVCSDETIGDDGIVNATLKLYALADPNIPSPHIVTARHFDHEGEAVNGNFGRVVEVKADAITKALIASTTAYQISSGMVFGENFGDGSAQTWGDADVIDILDDIDTSILSTEGKRKLGLVDSNFNSLIDVDDIQAIDNRVYGLVTVNAKNEIESITCPHCKTQDVYAVAHATYGCFQCDSEFPVKISMSDIHGE